MSEIDPQATMQPSGDPSAVPVADGLPETFSLKEKLREAPSCETWNVFDRVRKKKLVLKRYTLSAYPSQDILLRFRADFQQWQQLSADTVLLYPRLAGVDGEWMWSVREAAGAAKSLAETTAGGRSLRLFDISKRIVALCAVLAEMHRDGIVHRNIKPSNLFLVGSDAMALTDPDLGHFRDPTCFSAGTGVEYDPDRLGATTFLAPEQRPGADGTIPVGPCADIWSLALCVLYAVSGGLIPNELDPSAFPAELREFLQKALASRIEDRFANVDEFREAITMIGKANRPTLFTNNGVESSAVVSAPAPTVSDPTSTVPVTPSRASSEDVPSPETARNVSAAPPENQGVYGNAPPSVIARCPACNTPVTLESRLCTKCNRPYEEPCLSCNVFNPFWLKQCRGCGGDLQSIKQKAIATLKQQQQYVMKLREACGHDKALPILKTMSLLNHPDCAAFRDWAKSMFSIVQKERRDIRAYVDNVKTQAQTMFDAQKYDRVQKTIEQIPAPLLNDELRKMYVEAGDCITEVDSLIREIRNAIAAKQYSTLLSCVQRYLELKANDPEARSLQEKIEKLTTVTTATGMKLRRIPNGKFYMGSHDSDEFIRNNEAPQHRVGISKPLLIGVYPVMQSEYHALFDFNPSISTDQARCPVDNVTWYGAVDFCNRLSEKEGLAPYYEITDAKRRSSGMVERATVTMIGGDGYRLPTEAEWEYACRAGSITPWCFGDIVTEVALYAWYFDNAQQETHPVGLKKPNSWGLFDMHGNVMEWCHDWFDEFYYQHCSDAEDPLGPEDGVNKVIRGGSWQFGPESTRSAYRNSYNPEQSTSVIGFRVLRAATEGGL